jgi:hypothetical protein
MNITLITPSSPNISAFGARSLSSFLKKRVLYQIHIEIVTAFYMQKIMNIQIES